jgi:hypothetical protein
MIMVFTCGSLLWTVSLAWVSNQSDDRGISHPGVS